MLSGPDLNCQILRVMSVSMNIPDGASVPETSIIIKNLGYRGVILVYKINTVFFLGP